MHHRTLPLSAFDRAIAQVRLDLCRRLWTLNAFSRIVVPLGAIGMFVMLQEGLTTLWRCSKHPSFACGETAYGVSEAFFPFELGLFLSACFRLSHHALHFWCDHLSRQLDV